MPPLFGVEPVNSALFQDYGQQYCVSYSY